MGGGLKTLKRTLSEGWQSSEAKGKQFIYRRNFMEWLSVMTSQIETVSCELVDLIRRLPGKCSKCQLVSFGFICYDKIQIERSELNKELLENLEEI